MSIVAELERVVGAERVSTSEAVCLSYAYNAILGKEVVRKPDVVVMPRTTEEVSGVIRAANRCGVPVTPKGAAGATGHGGALRGGILLDLTLMDRIVHLDPLNMQAIAEAGCSFFKLSQELFKVGLMLPTAPYGAGPNVAASAITPVNAFGETRYGANINLVEGFEVVLPTGEITRVGSMAYADTEFGPYYRYITGPDLVGLFTKSNGALGIVTKVAYRCLRRPKHWSFHAWYWPEEKARECTAALMEGTAVETFGIHLMDRWCWVKINELDLPDDCQFLLLFLLDAQNEQEMAGKEQTMKEICAGHGGTFFPGFAEDFYTRWPTHFYFMEMVLPPRSTLPARMPRRYMFIFDELIYPTSWLPEAYGKIRGLLAKYGMGGADQPVAYSGFPMNAQTISAHSWGPFDDSDPELMARFHACQAEFREWFGKKGGTFQMRLPPLAPDYAWTNQPGALKLLKTIKAALDPHGILSP
ncbi:MAG: FAD-binding oxidoreductase, partial [Deltaproteobacteria bacterium]|nr:FAD-binding oxidoreductase [Deltaproteobacteria bacterium]